MNKIFSTLILCASLASGGTIHVRISGVHPLKGDVMIGLFKNQNRFPKSSKRFKSVHLDIHGKSLSYVFKNIPKGTYAIAVMHDKNRNGKLDTNFFGVPKEGYGFSNNIHPALRPATFKEAHFALRDEKSLTIRMQY
jgi:uncharacterized protein (DUF2141 family)